MGDDPALRQELLELIEARRESIRTFLHHWRPRRNRLLNVSIVSTALAAALTAGPALGGLQFTDAVQRGLALDTSSTVWRTLCFGALVTSLVAAISTNLSKAQDLSAQVTAAEACNAELEGLETLLRFGQLHVADGVNLYQEYVVKIPFVEQTPVSG
jgi:hypothetical protein